MIVKKETGIFLNNVVTEEFDFELPKDHVRPILEIIASFEHPPKEFLSRRSSLKEIFMNVGKSSIFLSISFSFLSFLLLSLIKLKKK